MNNPQIRIQIFALLFLFHACVCAAAGFAAAPVSAGGHTLQVSTGRDDAVYKEGDAIVFNITLKRDNTDDTLPENATVTYELARDGMFHAPIRKGSLAIKDGACTLKSEAGAPGFLHCKVTYAIPGAPRPLIAHGGAAIDPLAIRPSMPAPDDFDAFWAAQKKLLADTPANIRLTRVESNVPGVECFDLQADCPGVAPLSAYLARPAGAKPRSLPAIVLPHGAGVVSSRKSIALQWARDGFIAIDFNAHGIPNGQPPAFYKNLLNGELKDYRLRGIESRETMYLRTIIMRLLRALDVATSQPEWDGKILVVNGRSQGGGQAIAAAGLDPRVTFIAVEIPAFCDLTAITIGRANGWPRLFAATEKTPNPRIIEASRYYDAANFVTRTKAQAFFTVGFIDVVCAPTGIYAVYNQIPGVKKIWNHVDTGHVSRADYNARVRDEVLAYIKNARSKPDDLLWYEQPAAGWHEVLPLGNGRLGAMVHGHLNREHLQLNEETIWSFPGVPADAFNRDGAYKQLPEVRRLLFAGRQNDAEAIINREFLGERPLGYYQPLADLFITQTHKGEPADSVPHRASAASAAVAAQPQFRESMTEEIIKIDAPDAPGASGAPVENSLRKLPPHVENYRRELNLADATSTVTYRIAGVTYTRRTYVSAPHQVIVHRITADKRGSINMDATLSRAECADAAQMLSPAVLELRGQPDRGTPAAGPDFVARLRVINENGVLSQADASTLRVREADAVTILVAAASTHNNADPAATVERRLAAAASLGPAALHAAHLDKYQPLYRRSAIELPAHPALSKLPTDRRLAAVRKDKGTFDESLVTLFYNYGRYLLLSSSRDCDLAANLQGIWNPHIRPPWFSGWHFDINTSMNYWLAAPAGLPELNAPLFALIDNLRVNGRVTAHQVYNARGFVASHRTNPSFFTAPVKGLTTWPVAAGWLCQHLYEYYRFTRDRDFLATRAYPVMREAAEFFLDHLTPDPDTGLLVSGPSLSPENSFLLPPDKRPHQLTMGPAMDRQIIAELFDNTLAAARELGIADDTTRAIAAARAKLAPTQIAPDGRIMEWRKEYAEYEPAHRHMSHLYALHPGWQITPRKTPALAAAAKKSLAARMAGEAGARNASNSGNTGWSLAWNASLHARLHNSTAGRDSLVTMLREATWPNLMDTHPAKGLPHGVFQIDGNLAAPAAIIELLLQSHEDEIALLPALPAEWAEGSFTNLRARGGFTVSVQWRDGRLLEAQITAAHPGPCDVRATVPIEIFDGATAIAKSRPAPDGTTHLVRFPGAPGKTFRALAGK
jgi:alpha-L-fucosidase 2